MIIKWWCTLLCLAFAVFIGVMAGDAWSNQPTMVAAFVTLVALGFGTIMAAVIALIWEAV